MSEISPAQILVLASEEERVEFFSKLSIEDKANLNYHWPFWARPSQLEPGTEGSASDRTDWDTWLILSGRGFGKSRTGSETIRKWVCGDTPLSGNQCQHIALIAETASDARDVMVEGPAGLLACHPKDFRPIYEPSKRRVTWKNGATATLFNATEPDQLRGPNHDGAWWDELAKYQYAQETWDQGQFGLRLGKHPRQIVTTTPRPIPLIKKLISDPRTVVTRGSTFDNKANLAEPFLRQIQERYGGTRLGRQELEGEVLDDIPGSLFSREDIEVTRILPKDLPDLERIVVAIDPAVSSEEDSDETGIIVCGIARDNDGYIQGYILEDGTTKGTPDEWARKAVHLYRKYSADRIIAERNNGGEMVESVIRSVDRSLPIKTVFASRGKHVRAEPISALYEQHRIHHVGRLDKLEDQMVTFSIDNLKSSAFGSPDRVDALVWGLTDLFGRITGKRKADTEKPPKPAPVFSGQGAWLGR
jgi:phage terminase large subunit-like protein